jgi:hypothetical protein
MKNDWSSWVLSEAQMRQIPGAPLGKQEMRVWITCPHCKVNIDAAAESAMSNRHLTAKRHLKVCLHAPPNTTTSLAPSRSYTPKAELKRKCEEDVQAQNSDSSVTIYALIDTLYNIPVYTGKAVDPHRRLLAHRRDAGSCRLVRQFVRKHGKARIDIKPLVRCSAADADANESFYIVKNNTMYPNGLNLMSV